MLTGFKTFSAKAVLTFNVEDGILWLNKVEGFLEYSSLSIGSSASS